MSDPTQEITIYTRQAVEAFGHSPTLEDSAVITWLEVKGNKSEKTRAAYTLTMNLFRAMLQKEGLDVFSDTRLVARMAEKFVVRSYDNRNRVKGNLSEGTINQRRAILSSFYQYAHKYNKQIENPIDLVEKQDRNVHYAAAHLETKDVTSLLAQIDRSTLAGKRDYALLLLAVTTGRRARELAALKWGDIRFVGAAKIEVTFSCKGNKTMRDEIGKKTRAALEAYLHALYGKQLAQLGNETPIFVSFSRNNHGKALSVQALSDISEKHLGYSQFHTTRHTFAMGMKAAGASITDISKRLGHADEKTTREYLEQRESAVNRHIDTLESLYGL